jgi:hypothetical protein
MARELAARPDSPASLKIMSAVAEATLPRRRAVEQLVQAYTLQLQSPGPMADASVRAAERHWETVCGVPIDDDVREGLREDAAGSIARSRSKPPPVESVVAGLDAKTDVGYDLGIHLEGLRGTWHRLWAAIAMGASLGETPEQRECVATVRAQFESILGRALDTSEWSTLEQHAIAHGQAIASRVDRDPEPSG